MEVVRNFMQKMETPCSCNLLKNSVLVVSFNNIKDITPWKSLNSFNICHDNHICIKNTNKFPFAHLCSKHITIATFRLFYFNHTRNINKLRKVFSNKIMLNIIKTWKWKKCYINRSLDKIRQESNPVLIKRIIFTYGIY